ncbi:MAG: hypothetical protein DRO67_04360 [Candidatus Asgardarchaeum californiense]|nr:MAG: hypothetical protein DRO67_04360 [Candidatus Asgardarchaeum californiense]
MTGPCKGKVPVNLSVELYNDRTWNVQVNAYIHVKGYAEARVTHLDLESPELNFENDKQGFGVIIVGRENGFVVVLPKSEFLVKAGHKYKKIRVSGLKILENKERVGGHLGLKVDGIFIGFKKKIVEKLEEIARKLEPDLFTESTLEYF